MTYIMLQYLEGRKQRNFAARTFTLTLRYIGIRLCTGFVLLSIESN